MCNSSENVRSTETFLFFQFFKVGSIRQKASIEEVFRLYYWLFLVFVSAQEVERGEHLAD